VPAEPTPQEIEAFRSTWLQADAVGLYGERTRFGLRAVFALHDAETGEPEYGREIGYRLADGTEVWAVDHSDGSWTPVLYGPPVPGEGPPTIVTAIDVDESTTVEQVAAYLPPGAVVLVRPVRTYLLPVEETPVPVDGSPGVDGSPE
jgi:hypothetical protein